MFSFYSWYCVGQLFRTRWVKTHSEAPLFHVVYSVFRRSYSFFGAIIRMSHYFKNPLLKLSFYMLVVRISFKSDICCLSENCVSNTFLIFRRSLSYQAPVELLFARFFVFFSKKIIRRSSENTYFAHLFKNMGL